MLLFFKEIINRIILIGIFYICIFLVYFLHHTKINAWFLEFNLIPNNFIIQFYINYIFINLGEYFNFIFNIFLKNIFLLIIVIFLIEFLLLFWQVFNIIQLYYIFIINFLIILIIRMCQYFVLYYFHSLFLFFNDLELNFSQNVLLLYNISEYFSLTTSLNFLKLLDNIQIILLIIVNCFFIYKFDNIQNWKWFTKYINTYLLYICFIYLLLFLN